MIVLVIIGLVLNLQSVTVLSGAGVLWLGTGLCAAAVALAFAIRLRVVIKVIALVLLLLCLVNCINTESELASKRHELQQILNNTP